VADPLFCYICRRSTRVDSILRYVLIVVVRGIDVIVEDGRRIRRRRATGKEERDSWEAYEIVRGNLDMGFGCLGIKTIDK
jgi:hypothetical protein